MNPMRASASLVYPSVVLVALLVGCEHSPTPEARATKWEWRGPAQFTTSQSPGGPSTGTPSPENPDGEVLRDLDDMSVDELARNLRPIMLFKGHEYEASWSDALVLAEQAIAARQKTRTAPSPGANGQLQLTQQKSIVAPSDTRAAVSGNRARDAPYKYLGFMRRDLPAQHASAMCTCTKMINHATCVTAAHCVHTGPEPEDGETPDRWKSLPEITFLATSGMPMQTLDPDVHPYAVIIPSGWRLNRHLDFAVLRFRGSTGSFSGDLTPYSPPDNPAVVNVPNVHFDMGPTEFAGLLVYPLTSPPNEQRVEGDFLLAGFPGMASEFPSAACGSMSPCLAEGRSTFLAWKGYKFAGKRMFYYPIDTSGGQSGAAVWAVAPPSSQFPFSVVAIHKGTGQADTSPTPTPNFPANYGVRLTDEVVQFLISAAGGSGTVFP
jgi:V8-like Glu-specific endopeptidase